MIVSCPSCYTRYLVDPIAVGHDGRDVRCAKCLHTWFQDAPNAPPAGPGFIDDFLQNKPDITAVAQAPAGLIDELLDIKPDPKDTSFIDDFLTQQQPAEPEDHLAWQAEGEEEEEEDAGPPPIIGEIPSMEDLEELESMPGTGGLPAVIGTKTPGWIKTIFFLLLLCVLGTGFIAYNAALVKIIPAFEPVYSALGFYPTDGVTLADLSITKLSSGRKDRYSLKCSILNTSDEERRVPRMDVSLLSLEGYIIAGYNDVMKDKKLLAPGKSMPCDKLVLELDSLSKHARKVLIDMGNNYELLLR